MAFIFVPGVVTYSTIVNSFIISYMNDEYSGLGPYILVACLAYIFRGLYCFSVAPLFFYKHTRLIPLITILFEFLSIFLYFLCVSKFGLIGAVWGIFLTFVINFGISRAFEIYKGYKVKIYVQWHLLIGALIIHLINFYIFFNTQFLITVLISSGLYVLLLSLMYFSNAYDFKKQILKLREDYLV